MNFLDTNILLYSISKDKVEELKCRRARALLERDDNTLSVQVFQEFYVQATRATRNDPISHRDAGDLIASWMRFRIEPVDLPLLRIALDLRARFALSYWDATIVGAAQRAECKFILTEDLQDGQILDRVKVVNPFK